MPNELFTLLKRWHIAQPDICRYKSYPFSPNWYLIGDYEFAIDTETGELVASWGIGVTVRGQPALDWLEGVTRRAIAEARLYWLVEYRPIGHSSIVALLTAFVQWMEAKV